MEDKHDDTLILINKKWKSQILGMIHETKYTATTNQSVASNQRFTTKQKASKRLKILDELWESTENSSAKWKSTSNQRFTTNQLKQNGNLLVINASPRIN